MISLLIFIAIICFLIILHEWGHFIVARLNGVKVEKFSIGFGPVIFKKKIKETEFLISLLPLGGYVKLAGDDPQEFKGKDEEFLSKPCGIRARIVLGGPLLNYLFAFIFISLVFMVGAPTIEPIVGKVMDDFPAKQAGLKEGDRILEVNSHPIDSWKELQQEVLKSKGKRLLLKIKRDSQVLNISITPKQTLHQTIFGIKQRRFLIGITPLGKVSFKKYPFWVALVKGFKTLIFFTVLIFKSLFYMVIGALSFKEAVTGPLGMYYITKEAVRVGISAVLHLVGIVNLSLAIFNLLPFPVLHGGHLLFLLLEKIRKKRISPQVEEWINKFALSVLILLIIFVFLNDISRFVVNK